MLWTTTIDRWLFEFVVMLVNMQINTNQGVSFWEVEIKVLEFGCSWAVIEVETSTYKLVAMIFFNYLTIQSHVNKKFFSNTSIICTVSWHCYFLKFMLYIQEVLCSMGSRFDTYTEAINMKITTCLFPTFGRIIRMPICSMWSLAMLSHSRIR